MTIPPNLSALPPGFVVLRSALDDVSLVLADTAADAAWARTDHSVLTEQEINYSLEFDPELATTWAAGRVVLRHVLGSVLDCDPGSIEIRLDIAGKPRVTDCEFSVTRAQRLVLVAVAADPVGVDLEAIPEDSVAAEAAALLHSRERDELAQLEGRELAESFVRVWARKEAFLKALSTGLARDPGMDYIGAAGSPQSPHPDVDIVDVVNGIPAGYSAALAVNR
ncbi:4'-phosphopantetheinyl transferase superfamily protein [Brevibacterium sp.]|uniref:4'-phosphopantetheinyl transferase family protein n=1 Tax=Brevibacterium sp. TaxID=1701 RepID=UPI0028119E34|nr:4'-phosphopantetheinyl transferase superfamily protein [Brevibacterium sp.]